MWDNAALMSCSDEIRPAIYDTGDVKLRSCRVPTKSGRPMTTQAASNLAYVVTIKKEKPGVS